MGSVRSYLGCACAIALAANAPLCAEEYVETLPPLRIVAPAAERKVVPIALDAVLRLAGDQNGQIRIARARLEEANIKGAIANQRWLPDISVGPSFYRHEGGIQDFQGNLVRSSYGSLFGGLELRGKLDLKELTFRKVDAERNALQRRGELARLTNEQLLEAASAYVDLLTARTAIAVSIGCEKQLAELLQRARRLADIDPGANVEVVRIESELGAHRVLHRTFEQQAESSRLRLMFLVGLDPDADVALLDEISVVQLVDDALPPAQLVDRALQHGPGVAELSQLLAVVDRLHQKSHERSPLTPTLEFNVADGAYGAGPGASTNWDNRFDLGIHLRWSLNDFADRRNQQRLLDAQREQARLSFDDLRAKLTLGVRQALAEIKSGREQIQLAVKHIQSAEESFRLSDNRLRDNIKGRSPSEVLLASRSLFAARLSYLNAIRDFDRAQLRLFLLVGADSCNCP